MYRALFSDILLVVRACCAVLQNGTDVILTLWGSCYAKALREKKPESKGMRCLCRRRACVLSCFLSICAVILLELLQVLRASPSRDLLIDKLSP